MIAIYARQSLDKKDSISIETQIDLCKREIYDEDIQVYKDKGYSGKNTDRPAFKRLMEDIKSGRIEKLIVYRLDRISRSVADFANIMDILTDHKVSFVSANEKFDTSTPVGNAMLYIIMVFAQLERETITERIKDNYYARGKTGVWLGGSAPFGYSNVRKKTNGKNISTIEPNEDIELVKRIFDMYGNSSMSLGKIAKILNRERNEMWNNLKLSRMLHNPAYVKANADIYSFYYTKKCIIVNGIEDFDTTKGCNLYGKRLRSVNKYNSIDENVLAISLHEGVIDPQLWLKCQYKLEGNVQIKNAGSGKYTWLTGLVKCGYCGYSMNVKLYKETRYFGCSGKYVANVCDTKRDTCYVSAVEDYVTSHMFKTAQRLNEINLQEKTDDNSKKSNALKIQIHKIDEQIETLINNLTSANETLISYANKKIIELDEQKTKLFEELNKEAIHKPKLIVPDLSNWDNEDMTFKKEVAQMLIDKVLVYNDSIEIQWKF